jgi:Ser/Thr protein kinase RdoA (MazF antagonist)
MSDTYFKVRYSQLDTAALNSVLIKRYNLEEPVSCRLFKNGLNDVYKIKTAKEVYYLRISLTGVHGQRDYEEEISIINTLCENGIRAASPVRCRDGCFVWAISAPEGIRYAVLFSEVKQEPSDDKVKQSYNLGIITAQIHTVADEKSVIVSRPPYDFNQMANKPLSLIQPNISHRPDDYDFLCGAAEKLCRYIKENLNYEKPYYGYCHGDIQDGNVFYTGDEPEIFDFDCMGYGWRAYDIGVFAMNHEANYIESDSWKAFLEGYNSIRQLSKIELESVSAFAALHLLWVMGIHADLIDRNQGCIFYCSDYYFNHFIGIFKMWYERTALK